MHWMRHSMCLEIVKLWMRPSAYNNSARCVICSELLQSAADSSTTCFACAEFDYAHESASGDATDSNMHSILHLVLHSHCLMFRKVGLSGATFPKGRARRFVDNLLCINRIRLCTWIWIRRCNRFEYAFDSAFGSAFALFTVSQSWAFRGHIPKGEGPPICGQLALHKQNSIMHTIPHPALQQIRFCIRFCIRIKHWRRIRCSCILHDATCFIFKD